jgi:hypothetical protein
MEEAATLRETLAVAGKEAAEEVQALGARLKAAEVEVGTFSPRMSFVVCRLSYVFGIQNIVLLHSRYVYLLFIFLIRFVSIRSREPVALHILSP